MGTLVDDAAAYGDMTPYFSVPAGTYTLDITPASDNSTVVASFTADLSGLGGGAAVVFASGFLAPMDNQSGEAFGLFAALPNGTVFPLSAVTSVRRLDAPLAISEMEVYPNPARSQSTVRFTVQNDVSVQVRLYDMTGRVVYSAERGTLLPGIYDAVIPTTSLAPGIYRLLVSTGDAAASTTLSVIR